VGLDYAFMDTDSIAFARPDGMGPAEFYERCARAEDENDWKGEREPLYFVGVSAKRCALWNRLPDGVYRIRKFSTHGLFGNPKWLALMTGMRAHSCSSWGNVDCNQSSLQLSPLQNSPCF
jgi:hypothetical protein